MQEFKKRLTLALLAPLGAATLKGLTATWRFSEGGRTEFSPFSRPKHACIYAVWHECALAAGHYSGQPLHALASRSFDGEIISRVLERLGWLKTARGSSSKGGGSGLKEMRAYLNAGEHVLLTVDGPRGPRRLAKDGVIQLARLSGHAVVPVGFACRPAPRLGSWDRMIVPPPFAKGVFWFGDAQEFPGNKNASDDLAGLQQGLSLAADAAATFLAAQKA